MHPEKFVEEWGLIVDCIIACALLVLCVYRRGMRSGVLLFWVLMFITMLDRILNSYSFVLSRALWFLFLTLFCTGKLDWLKFD